MQQSDYKNLIKTCKKYGKTEPRLWVDALTYFSEKNPVEVKPYIIEVLDNIAYTDQLSPIEVIKILSEEHYVGGHSVEIIQKYLTIHLSKLHDKLKGSYTDITKHISEIGESKQTINSYKTEAQKFKTQVHMEPPFVHFLANKGPVIDESTELKDMKSHMEIIDERLKGLSSIDYPKFTAELEKKKGEEGYDTIATYLQKRIFDHPEQSGSSTFNTAMFEELGLVPI